MLLDWYEDGRVDRTYELGCYEQAMQGLPPDLRDYTDAAEVIQRALQGAVRRSPAEAAKRPAVSTSSSSTGTVLVLTGASLALLAAGGLWLHSRTRSGPGEDVGR